MGKIYVGQTALKFIANTSVDLTTVTAQLIKYIKPGGIEGSWIAVKETPYADGLISYTIGNDVAEVTDVTCPADVDSSLGGKYWTLNSIDADYYVWYDVDNESTDPEPEGKTGIEIDIISGESAADVASKTAAAINNLDDFGASSASAIVTVTNADVGAITDAADVDAGVSVDVITQGTTGLDKAGKWLFWAYLSFSSGNGDNVASGEVYEREIYEQGQ
ncbi:hypothetical protein ES708_30271 [subsurface metagenome]